MTLFFKHQTYRFLMKICHFTTFRSNFLLLMMLLLFPRCCLTMCVRINMNVMLMCMCARPITCNDTELTACSSKGHSYLTSLILFHLASLTGGVTLQANQLARTQHRILLVPPVTRMNHVLCMKIKRFFFFNELTTAIS